MTVSDVTVSDKNLQAHVDGELTAEARAALAKAMLASEVLSHKVSELRSLTQLVRLAYREPPTPGDQRTESCVQPSLHASTHDT